MAHVVREHRFTHNWFSIQKQPTMEHVTNNIWAMEMPTMGLTMHVECFFKSNFTRARNRIVARVLSQIDVPKVFFLNNVKMRNILHGILFGISRKF